jgi:hypothetical protein
MSTKSPPITLIGGEACPHSVRNVIDTFSLSRLKVTEHGKN